MTRRDDDALDAKVHAEFTDSFNKMLSATTLRKAETKPEVEAFEALATHLVALRKIVTSASADLRKIATTDDRRKADAGEAAGGVAAVLVRHAALLSEILDVVEKIKSNSARAERLMDGAAKITAALNSRRPIGVGDLMRAAERGELRVLH